MTIKNLKDLEAVMKLCRKHKVRHIVVGKVALDVEILEEAVTNSEQPIKPADMPLTPYSHLTQEQLEEWSVPNS